MEGIPAYHRPVNTVFQDYALFPTSDRRAEHHVRLADGRRGQENGAQTSRLTKSLELVRLPGVSARKPHQLSGGQQQRVALARALVKRPAVLLLDEPLRRARSQTARKNMQYELKALQRDVGITFVYVTHDQEEAITMADRIAVMNEGEDAASRYVRSDIYEHPETLTFVADFIGETNFIAGEPCLNARSRWIRQRCKLPEDGIDYPGAAFTDRWRRY